MKESIILGVDPGTVTTGYALLQEVDKKPRVLAAGVVILGGQGLSHGQKLHKIYLRISNLIQEYKPSVLAIEAPFYGKNIQATLKLGRAQGIVIAAALAHNIAYQEYSPREIKKAVCGYGNASKKQISLLLLSLFPDIKNHYPDSFLDAYDALACALCHYYRRANFSQIPVTQKFINPSNKTKGTKISKKWEQFILNNPARIRNRKNQKEY